MNSDHMAHLALQLEARQLTDDANRAGAGGAVCAGRVYTQMWGRYRYESYAREIGEVTRR